VSDPDVRTYVAADRTTDVDWWKTAVFYQVYPRSFADSNGDGVGDLQGVRSRLDYLADLGVDALWLSPFYLSPMADHGYDVADPTDVDPIFGTLADFDALVADAHDRGIKITVDLVPNHFSVQHVWFQEALAAAPGSPARERFIFRDGKGPDGSLPPNNWPSIFGGPAWERVEDGQWYLHLFAPEQPDVNWANPAIPAEFARVIRFWLDRGADGFRVDVGHSMAKPEGLPDMAEVPLRGEQITGDIRFDHPEVHTHLRGIRSVLDEYAGAMAVGEVWVDPPERLAAYVRPDELHLTFNFALVTVEWGAKAFRDAIEESFSSIASVGAPNTWVLSNHDIVRHPTRFGGGSVGRDRGRAAALVQLSLPGVAYLYNGDELGLENVDLPDEVLQDPVWERSGHTDRGRDGERVPMPWSGSSAPYGFSSNPNTWLPMPAYWAPVTVEAEQTDPDSTLSLYKRMLQLRKQTAALQSEEFVWVDAAEDCIAYRRGDSLLVMANFGEEATALPTGKVLLSSGPVVDGQLPANTAVWLDLS
jgi:alpha-glucosidase